MDLIPITSLTPESAPPVDKCIQGIVTLSWPYSSSTRQCALLLADKDSRLRHRKGQVRVRFTGAAAEAVAKSHVGIGDEVTLGLRGASWEQDPEATKTPGKSVDGELVYRRRLVLNVAKAEGSVEINVDAPVSPMQSPERQVEIATPLPKAAAGLQADMDGKRESVPSFSYTSPAFVKRLRLSGESFLDSAYDPFAGDDVDTELLAGKYQSSFGSNLRWRYADDAASPKKDEPGHGILQIEDDGESIELRQPLENEVKSASSTTQQAEASAAMLSPPLPPLQVPASQLATEIAELPEATAQRPEEPSTPELRPIESSTLPLASPFPGEGGPHLGLSGAITSLVDERQPLSGSISHEASMEDLSQFEGERELDQSDLIHDPTMREYPSDTEPDDEITQQTLLQIHNIENAGDGVRRVNDVEMSDDITRLAPADELDSTVTSKAIQQDMAQEENEELFDHAADNQSLKEGILLSFQPQTPAKIDNRTQRIGFGLDGASSAGPSPEATSSAKSVKDKIMAQTYRSLFGFRASPEVLPSSQPQEPESPTPATRLTTSHQSGLDVTSVPLNEISAVEPVVESLPEAITEDHALEVTQQTEQPPVSSNVASRVEVIDLGSSSEDEDELPMERTFKTRGPQPEVQDSQIDLDAEDLLESRNDAVQAMSAIRQREAEASKLREMARQEETEQTPDETTSLQGRAEAREREDFDESMRRSPETSFNQLKSPPPTFVPSEISHAKSSPTIDQLPESEPVRSYESRAAENSLGSEQQEMMVSEPIPPITSATVVDLRSSSPVDPIATSPVKEDAIDKFLNEESLQLEGDDALLSQSQTEEQVEPIPTDRTHPSLPLSPSSSQPVQAKQSNAHPGTVVQYTGASIFPPTPRLTQAESSTHLLMSPTELFAASQRTDLETSSQAQEASEELMKPKLKKKPPKKKSLTARLSSVPDVISEWFSPKSNGVSLAEAEGSPEQHVAPEHDVARDRRDAEEINDGTISQFDQPQRSAVHTNGFATALSYFSPLSRLEELLNPPSQQAYGSNTVDIFAVMTDHTSEPSRAKGGPRHYFTIFQISDASLSAPTAIRVEVYRPWKATLPVASVGDVILLRAFAVKSRKRQPYLLSTDASAWCVWRYDDRGAASDSATQPVWARRTGSSSSGAVREEVKGPPVELGQEERDYAGSLREWWQKLQLEQQQYEPDDMHDGPEVNGHASHSIEAGS